LRACDEHKDQTYFMWRVPGTLYRRALFPIGGFATKKDVRAACAERGLGIENKPDSDGICFIGPVGLRTFLLERLERRLGDVVEWETGEVLGHHDGAFLFTIGQRRGLDLGGGPARYVVATNVATNEVFVSADPQCPALWTRVQELDDVCWVAGEAPREGDYLVRTRHTGPLRTVRVELTDAGVRLHYPEPVRTVAPGQSAVIYDGLVCLGGGIIKSNATPA
jgi:tRNA-specific 2-thiouridylase